MAASRLQLKREVIQDKTERERWCLCKIIDEGIAPREGEFVLSGFHKKEAPPRASLSFTHSRPRRGRRLSSKETE
jgi:hypothetical protein